MGDRVTELQYEKKILELNQYLEKINSIVWTEICDLDMDRFSMDKAKEVVDVLNEWSKNN